MASGCKGRYSDAFRGRGGEMEERDARSTGAVWGGGGQKPDGAPDADVEAGRIRR